MIPFGDASRHPLKFPIVTALIIAANALVFMFELVVGMHSSTAGRKM